MFQFPRFAPYTHVHSDHQLKWPGCPIRKSRDQRSLAPPPSLSQLATSFFASDSLGIPRAPLFCFLALGAGLPQQAVTKKFARLAHASRHYITQLQFLHATHVPASRIRHWHVHSLFFRPCQRTRPEQTLGPRPSSAPCSPGQT